MALKMPIPCSLSSYSRRFCSCLQVLPYTENAAMQYGSMHAALECVGRLVGVNDLQIAVHARSHGLILSSNNLREFERVLRLMMENWLV
jgi:tRNA(fMet)-specific endonuclease VapC